MQCETHRDCGACTAWGISVRGVSLLQTDLRPSPDSLIASPQRHPSTMTILLTQNLGKIRGRDSDKVTQFLGIKYATLSDRLADAQLIETRDGEVLDATKDG